MKKFNKIVISGLVILSVLASCKKEKNDPIIPNEEEVITTLNYTLTPTGGGTAIVLSFQDLDGDGVLQTGVGGDGGCLSSPLATI